MLVSETSGPVSSRTRSSEKRTDDGDDREASRGGDDRRRGDDANTTATGRGATGPCQGSNERKVTGRAWGVGVACSGVWQLCVCQSEYSADLDLKH